MAAFDLYATCNAMATKWAAVTPPSGETMRKVYGQAPNGVPMTPCGIFVPQSGTLILAPGAYNGTHLVDGVFLLGKAEGDLARIETRRQKWLPVLYHAMDAAMAVGLAPVVKKVYPTGWEFAEYSYGGATYDAIIVHFNVDTFETVTLAA